jgi:hypothetical protein
VAPVSWRSTLAGSAAAVGISALTLTFQRRWEIRMRDLMRILFVSKDPDFTKALIRFLGGGFDVECRGSFAIDVDAIRAIDAILLDLHTSRSEFELPPAPNYRD